MRADGREDLKTERSRRTLAIPAEVAPMSRPGEDGAGGRRRARLPRHGPASACAMGRPWPQPRKNSSGSASALGSRDWQPEQRLIFVSILSDAGVDIDQIADAAGRIQRRCHAIGLPPRPGGQAGDRCEGDGFNVPQRRRCVMRPVGSQLWLPDVAHGAVTRRAARATPWSGDTAPGRGSVARAASVMRAAPPPGGQAHQDGGTYADNNRGHDQWTEGGPDQPGRARAAAPVVEIAEDAALTAALARPHRRVKRYRTANADDRLGRSAR